MDVNELVREAWHRYETDAEFHYRVQLAMKITVSQKAEVPAGMAAAIALMLAETDFQSLGLGNEEKDVEQMGGPAHDAEPATATVSADAESGTATASVTTEPDSATEDTEGETASDSTE